jgi:putative methanogenesis marker protein 5
MVKVMVYPPTSMILSDLVERTGHEALVVSKEVRKKVNTAGLDSPPLNMTPEDPKKGLKYAAVDVPSG